MKNLVSLFPFKYWLIYINIMMIGHQSKSQELSKKEYKPQWVFRKILREFASNFGLERSKIFLMTSLYIDIKPSLTKYFTTGKRTRDLVLVLILMSIKKKLYFLLKKLIHTDQLLLDWFLLHEKFYQFLFDNFQGTSRGIYHNYVKEIIKSDPFLNFKIGIKIFNTPLPVDKCKLMLNVIRDSLDIEIYKKTGELLSKMESEGYSFSSKNAYGILGAAIYFISHKSGIYINEAKIVDLLSISSNALKRRKKEIKKFL